MVPGGFRETVPVHCKTLDRLLLHARGARENACWMTSWNSRQVTARVCQGRALKNQDPWVDPLRDDEVLPNCSGSPLADPGRPRISPR